MQTDLPAVVVYDGTTYTGTRSTLKSHDILAREALRGVYEFSVYLRFADLGAVPDVTVGPTAVTVAGVQYRLLAIEQDPSGRGIRFDLGEKYAVR